VEWSGVNSTTTKTAPASRPLTVLTCRKRLTSIISDSPKQLFQQDRRAGDLFAAPHPLFLAGSPLGGVFPIAPSAQEHSPSPDCLLRRQVSQVRSRKSAGAIVFPRRRRGAASTIPTRAARGAAPRAAGQAERFSACPCSLQPIR